MNPTASNFSRRDRPDNDLSLDSLRVLSHNSRQLAGRNATTGTQPFSFPPPTPGVIRFLAVTCMPPDSSLVLLRVLDQRIHAETHLASILVLGISTPQRHHTTAFGVFCKAGVGKQRPLEPNSTGTATRVDNNSPWPLHTSQQAGLRTWQPPLAGSGSQLRPLARVSLGWSRAPESHKSAQMSRWKLTRARS